MGPLNQVYFNQHHSTDAGNHVTMPSFTNYSDSPSFWDRNYHYEQHDNNEHYYVSRNTNKYDLQQNGRPLTWREYDYEDPQRDSSFPLWSMAARLWQYQYAHQQASRTKSKHWLGVTNKSPQPKAYIPQRDILMRLKSPFLISVRHAMYPMYICICFIVLHSTLIS